MKRTVRVDLRPGESVTITYHAAQPADRPLTPCEADILETVGTRTLSRAEIVAELCDGPHAHGESTVNHALTRLVKDGWLRKGPENKGYLRTEKI